MKKKNQKIEMNSNQDELLESFKDFKLVSKTEMSQITGGMSYSGSTSDCDQYE